jgi:hypothetical protein
VSSIFIDIWSMIIPLPPPPPILPQQTSKGELVTALQREEWLREKGAKVKYGVRSQKFNLDSCVYSCTHWLRGDTDSPPSLAFGLI